MLRASVYAVPLRRMSFAIAERSARGASGPAVKSPGPVCKNLVHESGTERTAHPHRPGDADGQAVPALLAAGAARRGAARARLPTGAREDHGRAPRRLPRHAEPARPDRRVLRAPRGVALVRPQRGRRPSLLLPWLEVRHHWAVRRDPVGTEQSEALPAREAEGLSAPRTWRGALDLHGTAGAEAAAPRARVGDGAGRPSLRLQALAGVQLAAGDGRRDRLEPRLVPASPHDEGRPDVQGRDAEPPAEPRRPRAAFRGGRIARR